MGKTYTQEALESDFEFHGSERELVQLEERLMPRGNSDASHAFVIILSDGSVFGMKGSDSAIAALVTVRVEFHSKAVRATRLDLCTPEVQKVARERTRKYGYIT
jgi:hypothetical protein